MEVEQVFYGRGESGYTILGSSIPLCGVTDQVAELCQSIGTPGYERAEDNQLFLLQKVCGVNVLMGCGRTGDADGIGRKTLFFHVLVVRCEYAKERGLCAADFYRAGKFSERCLRGKIGSVGIDDVTGVGVGARGAEFHFPAVFQCRRAENLGLIGLLAGAEVGMNWATMSWRVLKGFDWYGLEASRSSASLPGELWVYDVEGKMRRAGRTEGNAVDGKESAAEGGNRCSGPTERSVAKCGAVVGVVGLVVGLMIGLMMGGGDTREQMGDGKVAQVEVAEDEKAVCVGDEEKGLEELKFDEAWRIFDFEKEMMADGTYQAVMEKGNVGDPRFKKERALYKKLEAYIEFVNKNFPKKENKKQEKEQKK